MHLLRLRRASAPSHIRSRIGTRLPLRLLQRHCACNDRTAEFSDPRFLSLWQRRGSRTRRLTQEHRGHCCRSLQRLGLGHNSVAPSSLAVLPNYSPRRRLRRPSETMAGLAGLGDRPHLHRGLSVIGRGRRTRSRPQSQRHHRWNARYGCRRCAHHQRCYWTCPQSRSRDAYHRTDTPSCTKINRRKRSATMAPSTSELGLGTTADSALF